MPTLWLSLALLLGGCHFVPGPGDEPVPAPPPVDPFDPDYLQVGSFNIDWLTADLPGEFTPRNDADLAMVASLIEAMDIDVLCLQEINGIEAIEALGLPSEWQAILGSTGWSQNVAWLYRADRVAVTNVREVRLPVNRFPSKDPLVADVAVLDSDLSFAVVGLHLNPYVESSEANYRADQVRDLVQWLDGDGAAPAPDLPVVVAGDLNDTRGGLNANVDALAPLEERLVFATADTEQFTNIPFQSQIDHVALDGDLDSLRHGAGSPAGVTVVAHDWLSPWGDYSDGYGGDPTVSTHRPVYVDLVL